MTLNATPKAFIERIRSSTQEGKPSAEKDTLGPVELLSWDLDGRSWARAALIQHTVVAHTALHRHRHPSWYWDSFPERKLLPDKMSFESIGFSHHTENLDSAKQVSPLEFQRARSLEHRVTVALDSGCRCSTR